MTSTKAQIEAVELAITQAAYPEVHPDFTDAGWRKMAIAALSAAAEVGNKIPASRKLLNITEAMWQSAEKECKDIEAATIERCAQVADDWFTLAPKYRTKENLLARIRAIKK